MFARSWRFWKEVDPVLSFGGYLYAAYAAVSGAAGVIAWATTYWAWYWQTFSWAGVGFAFLAAWLALAFGIFLIGIGIWALRKLAHPSIPAARPHDAAAKLNTARRPISGLEVVQRLEKLEEERAAAKAGEQRASGATMKITGTVVSAAKYSKAQINKIVEAIDAIYSAVQEIEAVLKFGDGLAQSMEAIIRDNGAPVFLERIDKMRLEIIEPSDRLLAATTKYSLYTEACNVVKDQPRLHETFFASYNELAGILREIPDKLSAPALRNYVDAKKSTFISRINEYLAWAAQKRKALSEYRSFYLRLQTTD